MHKIISFLQDLGMVHWLMMILGLLIHGLMRLGAKKTKYKADFNLRIFFDTHIREWLVSLFCSTACLIAFDYSGQLDESWGAAISLFVGYANSSFFRHVMIFIEGKVKKNTPDQ